MILFMPRLSDPTTLSLLLSASPPNASLQIPAALTPSVETSGTTRPPAKEALLISDDSLLPIALAAHTVQHENTDVCSAVLFGTPLPITIQRR